ncbi:MAG: phosphoribosylformylglycinamidine synthase subunit PurL [Firmicutes bacterium]|nr:phosphoribosylformylglycinamidine synthase subunit PurL [Bacillota bacterium]
MTLKEEKPWRQLGLTDEEYALISAALGREPNLVELNIYSVMWSEHCSYKHSLSSLRLLPTEGPQVLQGPGENAGVVALGGGWAAAFKIESHNHPTAVEPFQGAATGAGGIIRDIVAMGARPVALLGSLRFGPLSDRRSRYLFEDASSGLDWYSEGTGVPLVAKEVYFEESYRGNPLVNVMCIGVLPADQLMRGRAGGEDNPVLLAGARTGRDGIHGVTFASDELTAAVAEEPASPVQVGDAALGKKLMEATLEVIGRGLALGVQDLGGAGLSCALTEMAARGGCGIAVELARVPQSEEKMAPQEILVSETQERMLLVVTPENESAVFEAYEERGLTCARIGRVTADEMVTVLHRGEEVARVPAESVAGGAPELSPASREPQYYRERSAFDPEALPPVEDFNRIFQKIFAEPELFGRIEFRRSRGDLADPGHADAVLVRGEEEFLLAASLSGNGRQVYLDPYRGSVFAVAQAARRLACTGARALGITDGLNFGNPEKPEIFWQFSRSVEGIADACRALELPVVGGNVSFYNEVDGRAILPTPVIGALGVIEGPESGCEAGFAREGDKVYLLGASATGLGGSLFLKSVHGLVDGVLPPIDLELEARLQALLRDLINEGLATCLSSVGDGGLAVALAKSCLMGGCGAEAALPEGDSLETVLFGEGPTRALVAVPPGQAALFEERAREAAVPAVPLGESGGGRLRITVGGEPLVEQPLEMLQELYREAIPWTLR